MKIGKKIKDLRMQKGLTQEELADRSELSKGIYISIRKRPYITLNYNLSRYFAMSRNKFGGFFCK